MAIGKAFLAIGLISIVGVFILPSLLDKKETPQEPEIIVTGGKKVSNLKWTDCDGTGSRFYSISSIKIDGNFAAGTTVTFTTLGTTNVQWTIASSDVQVKLGIITVYTGTEQINPPQTYPVGPLVFPYGSTCPAEPPAGNYQMTTRHRDPKNNLIQCVLISYTLS